MASIQTFTKFHKQEPTAQYSPIYGFHATCDTQLSQVTEGDVTLYFCPVCKVPDMQAFGALLAAISWLRDNEQEEITGDTALREYEESEPGSKPPITAPALRIWDFQYGITVDESAPDDDFGERWLSVILSPDGGYSIDVTTYRRCGEAGLYPGCSKFLHVNERGALACYEHGEMSAE